VGDEEIRIVGGGSALQDVTDFLTIPVGVRFLWRTIGHGCPLLSSSGGYSSHDRRRQQGPTRTVGLAEVVAPGEVVCVDLDEERLAFGWAAAEQRGLANVRFEPGGIHRLPFTKGAFDAALVHAGRCWRHPAEWLYSPWWGVMWSGWSSPRGSSG
jgi:hypothetical protein